MVPMRAKWKTAPMMAITNNILMDNLLPCQISGWFSLVMTQAMC
jgi:hypothetical protein